MDIVLALGGGGSKGNAHIGVLRVLEREGFRVRAIAGTSAGGMAAAAFAAGFTPDEIATRMKAVSQSEIFPVHFGDQPGFLSLEGVTKIISDMLGERTFADLAIPCALTAVDLHSGQEVILQQGRVVDAVLATVAIPGIFPPQKWGDYRLVDGGVLDPVPISVARSISPDVRLPVVAVVLSKPVSQRIRLPSNEDAASSPIVKTIARLKVAQAFDIFWKSLDIGMSASTEIRLQLDAPDVIIRPDVEHISPLDKVDVDEVIELGQQAAEAVLPEIFRAVGWQGKLKRYFRGSKP